MQNVQYILIDLTLLANLNFTKHLYLVDSVFLIVFFSCSSLFNVYKTKFLQEKTLQKIGILETFQTFHIP